MVDYKIEPPYEALDKDRPWYTAKVGATTWNILKAKLTGGTDSGGTGYSSTVNLSDEDADKLIENMKKDPRGYPQFDDGGGGMNFYTNYEKFQAWLVEQYLGKPVEQEEEEELEEDIPEGLDDLLGSIQDEPAEETPEPKVTTIKSSAIVPTKFLGERYEKYRDELLSEGTIEGEQLTGEERKEGFKSRNNSDKFKSFVDNFLNRKKEFDEVVQTGGVALISAKNTINADNISPPEEDEDDNLDDVLKGIDDILKVLKKDQELEKKKSAFEARKEEKKKRKTKEKNLEKTKEGFLGKAAKKIIKPVKSLFDKIFGFLKTILLGKALMSIIDWIANPDNKSKLDSIFRFFKDFWPTLLGAYILFGTSFGKFVRTIIGMTSRFTKRILTKGIPALIRAAAANPYTALAVAAVAGTALTAKMLGKDKVVGNETERQESTRQALEQAPSTKDKSAGDREALVQGSRLRDAGGGGSLNNMPNLLNDPLGLRQDPIGSGGMQAFAGGGEVKGKPGIDKNPAMLSDGEFVFSPGAVQKYGVDTLEAMNAAGGGTNMPKIMNNITYAAGGGLIGDKPRDPRKTGENPFPEPVALAMDGGGESFNILNPMTWFSGDAQKATKGELQDVSNDTLAGKLYNRRKQQEEAMKMLRGYDGGGEVEETTIDKMEFNPSNYFQGDNVYSSKRIVNPGQTGKSFFVKYAQNNDGSIEIRQVNKVVKDGNIFNGFTPDLTGVKPGSDEFQKVVGSANTKGVIENELKDRAQFTTRSSAVSKEMKPERDKVNAWIKGGRNLSVSPHAMVGYDYNQSYQTTKAAFEDTGVAGKKGEQLSAAAAAELAMPNLDGDATVLPTSDESRISTDTVNQYTVASTPQNQDSQPMTAVEMIKNYLMAGLSMGGGKKTEEEKNHGQIITPENSEYDSKTGKPSNVPGITVVSKGSRAAKQGSKIAGELGRYLDKSNLGIWGSGVHQHPEHPAWPKESGHSAGSLHYESQGARAIDIGGWGPNLFKRKGGSGVDDQTQILKGIKDFNRKNQVKPVQLFHEGNDPAGHADHVHVAYSSGGEVKGKTGVDKNPAMLSKGEVVMNNEAVQGVGKQNLLAANKHYGGQDANKPKIVKGTMHAAGGGYVPAPAKVGDKNVKSAPITPMNRSKPKVTFVDLGEDVEPVGSYGGSGPTIPAFSASSSSRTKINTLGINI